MAARGTEAKNKVIEKIKSAFGADFIGEVDKKIYVWSNENGERIQIAITLTCPKVSIGETMTSDSGNFEDDFSTSFTSGQMSAEEIATAEALLKKLENL